MRARAPRWLATLAILPAVALGVYLPGGPLVPGAPAAAGLFIDSAQARSASTRFAVIGDFGAITSQPTSDVANLIRGWNVDFVVTVGDNNYCTGNSDGFAEFDLCTGRYYHEYIAPYLGSYGAGATRNRFWPALGNHDWDAGLDGWAAFFTLPNNERYYHVVQRPVHLFVIDSDPREPDGTSATGRQGRWLQRRLAASRAPWKLVVFHHPPYSSGQHGSSAWMQWPFQQWGATAVLSGHDHSYERLEQSGLPYIVNGLGGASIYPFRTPIAGSVVRYNSDYGAMLVTADACAMTFQFITRQNEVIDTVTQTQEACANPPPTPSATALPAVKPVSTAPATTTPRSVHIGDLDALAASVNEKFWEAGVAIRVHDGTHAPVVGAVVSGTWSGGAFGTGTCTTNAAGECVLLSSAVDKTRAFVTFTVDRVSASKMQYTAAANHDPDGDSYGTRIQVNRLEGRIRDES